MSTSTNGPPSRDHPLGAVSVVAALSVAPIGRVLPVALSNHDQVPKYAVGGSATPAATAAFAKVNVPSGDSFGSTTGLIAGR